MNVTLIAHNIRSVHNVGSLLRTAECLGVKNVYLTGYTPYPKIPHDTRLPHEQERIHKQIHKTALGAEDVLQVYRYETLADAVIELQKQGIHVAALEQARKATPLPKFKPTRDIAILVGNEVDGLDITDIALCDETVEIPMLGKKESLNVVQAAAMSLYQVTFWKNVLE